jgi:6-phosphofructokinase 1
MELVAFMDGINGLVENRTMPIAMDTLSGILTTGGTMLGTSREKVHKFMVDGVPVDMTDHAVESYEANELDCLVMLGGGGSAKNAKRLVDAGLNVVLLPKTIDNDLVGTDTSFGFATAMEIATDAVDRLHSTASSHHRIILVELMGHKVGWLTLGAGIAGGADVILIPELPYTVESIVSTVRQRMDNGSSFSVIAVGEGAREVGAVQARSTAKAEVKAAVTEKERHEAKKRLAAVDFEQREHTFKLARELEGATGLETRVTILGYVQRGGIPCAADRLLATRIGYAGADAVARGAFDVLVGASGEGTALVPIQDVAGHVKTVPPDHEWVLSARGVGTGLGD